MDKMHIYNIYYISDWKQKVSYQRLLQVILKYFVILKKIQNCIYSHPNCSLNLLGSHDEYKLKERQEINFVLIITNAMS